jgi:hypothetical protein
MKPIKIDGSLREILPSLRDDYDLLEETMLIGPPVAIELHQQLDQQIDHLIKTA